MKEIFNRRSVRTYADRKVEDDKIEQLLKAAMAAPTAGNQREWEFIVVTEKPILQKLSQVSPYAKCAADAPVAIVLLSNMADKRWPEYWEQDLGACAQNILLEAVHLELGGVWLGVAPIKERMDMIADIFSLPKEINPFGIVALGYPMEDTASREQYEPGKINYNEYKKH